MTLPFEAPAHPPSNNKRTFPYPALADKDLGFLCQHVMVRLVPTLTSLKLLAECPKAYHSTSGALLVGDPWVETVRFRRRKVKQLPSARKEVEMIGRILNVEPLIGKYVAKAEVLQRLNSVALVHIAAHGGAKAGEILLSPNPTNYERSKEEDFCFDDGRSFGGKSTSPVGCLELLS